MEKLKLLLKMKKKFLLQERKNGEESNYIGFRYKKNHFDSFTIKK